MFTVMDFILLAVVLIGMLFGLKQGFFNSIPSFVRHIAAFGLTVFISSAVIDFWTGPYFSGMIAEKVEAYIIENCPEITSETAVAMLPTALMVIAGMFGVEIPSSSGITSEEFIKTLAKVISEPIGNVIAVVVTYVALFLIITIVLKLLLMLLDVIFSQGILGWINRILGMILSGGICALIAMIVANITMFFVPDFQGGGVFNFFLKLNPLSFLLSF